MVQDFFINSTWHPFDISNVSCHSLGACRSRWTQGLDNLCLRPPSPCASVWLCGWWECGCCSWHNKKESKWMLDEFGWIWSHVLPGICLLLVRCIAAKVIFWGGFNEFVWAEGDVSSFYLIVVMPMYQEEIAQWHAECTPIQYCISASALDLFLSTRHEHLDIT